MSKKLIANRHFLELLLSTSREQALTLLTTVTKEQVLLIAEIAYNILQLPLPKKAKYYVNKKKKLIERLASKKLSLKKRTALITKNAKYLMLLLWALKQQFSELQ